MLYTYTSFPVLNIRIDAVFLHFPSSFTVFLYHYNAVWAQKDEPFVLTKSAADSSMPGRVFMLCHFILTATLGGKAFTAEKTSEPLL